MYFIFRAYLHFKILKVSNQEIQENLPALTFDIPRPVPTSPTYVTSTIQLVTPGYITTSGGQQDDSRLNRANMTTFNWSPNAAKPPGSEDLPPAYDSLYGID